MSCAIKSWAKHAKLRFMVWALSFFAAGMIVIAVLSLKYRPQPGVGLGFLGLVLLLFGVLSLGLTGSWLEVLFRPLIKALGLYPDSQDSLWRISMALSLLVPLSLVVAYAASRRVATKRVLTGVLVFAGFCLLIDIFVHILIRLI
jgi:hypothetical protein